jgi:hypothetical protein
VQIQIPIFQVVSHRSAFSDIGEVVCHLLEIFLDLVSIFNDAKQTLMHLARNGSLLNNIKTNGAKAAH